VIPRSRNPVLRTASENSEPVRWISSRTISFVIFTIVVFLYAIQQVLLPFVIAAVVAYICTPMVHWIAARAHLPRWPVAIVVFLILVALAAGFAWLGVPPLARDAMDLVSNFQGTIETLAHAAIGAGSVTILGQSMNASAIDEFAVNSARDWLGHADRLSMLAAGSFAAVFGVFLTLVLLFYFLVSGPSIAQGLMWLVPPKQRPVIAHVWSRLDPVLRRYFIGVIAVVAYAITAAYVGLGLVLGIKHAPFLAVLTGILEMIPVIGPGAAALIAGLVAVHYATGLAAILAYAIYATALRLSIDQLFGPIVLGSAARLHPVLIIFCFLSGGVLFGIAGVIISVPVGLGVRTTLATLYDDFS